MSTQPNPAMDGYDHINVYSKGRTTLGRWMSNFTRTPFRHPEYGHFVSMEGFWYYVKTGFQHEHLRPLWGASAKTAGRMLPKVEMQEDRFREVICSGISAKLRANLLAQRRLKECELPFTHYYLYGDRIVMPKDHTWQLDHWHHLRNELRLNRSI